MPMNKNVLIPIIFGFFALSLSAQDPVDCAGAVNGSDCDELRAITTAVPFLLISPDSRSGAMGEAGVALSPDANAQHWNASNLAFAEEE